MMLCGASGEKSRSEALADDEFLPWMIGADVKRP
jgi:hypothetical protein